MFCPQRLESAQISPLQPPIAVGETVETERFHYNRCNPLSEPD